MTKGGEDESPPPLPSSYLCGVQSREEQKETVEGQVKTKLDPLEVDLGVAEPEEVEVPGDTYVSSVPSHPPPLPVTSSSSHRWVGTSVGDWRRRRSRRT